MRKVPYLRTGVLALACAAVVAVPLQAQDFPPRQIAIVVSFPAGGGTDLFARVFAQKLAAALGTTVLVDNRPGAAGTVGNALVARAAPNGQTLLFTPSNLAMAPAIYKSLPYDTVRDLAPVIMTARIPFVLTVHPALPVRNVKDFLALARAKPGALDYGSSGAGSPPYFAMELLKYTARVNLNHIPYKGAGPILTGLMSGEVQASFLIPPLAMPQMQGGKLRGLAVSTPERSMVLPELPTLREAGVTGFEVTQWHGFFAPAKTPATIVNRLNAEVAKTLASAEIRQRLAAEGADIAGGTPADLGAFLAAEIKVWTDLAQRLGLKPE
ncbi:MAG: Bug family tripartite tricarboxylate transporter substrate binding protein [Burkholderiales bacterium]